MDKPSRDKIANARKINEVLSGEVEQMDELMPVESGRTRAVSRSVHTPLRTGRNPVDARLWP